MMFGHDEQQDTTNGAAAAPDLTLDQDAVAQQPQTDDTTVSHQAEQGGNDSQATDSDTESPAPAAIDDAGDLMHIKQQALNQLSPLLGHLEQSPQEHFRTTMMLIQASDNQKLIPQAYKAAQAITDEKVRAQALLDIVNEINYFTQQADSAGL